MVGPTFFTPKRVFAMFANNHHNDGHVAAWLPASPGTQEAAIAESPDVFSSDFRVLEPIFNYSPPLPANTLHFRAPPLVCEHYYVFQVPCPRFQSPHVSSTDNACFSLFSSSRTHLQPLSTVFCPQHSFSTTFRLRNPFSNHIAHVRQTNAPTQPQPRVLTYSYHACRLSSKTRTPTCQQALPS